MLWRRLCLPVLAGIAVWLTVSRAQSYPPPPPCITSADELGYVNGSLSSTQTFYNCLANIPDASMMPSYYNNRMNGPTYFSSGMTLNNLIEVDEIEGTATLSFSLGVSWIDDRFAMPIFWNSVAAKSIGLTILATNDSIVLYQPQIRFADAMEVSITNQELSLSKANMFLWKGAIVLKVVQSGFKFNKYPGDEQNIIVRFYMYPYDNRTAIMTIFGSGISFSTDENGEYTFPQNPLWSYISSTASTYNSQGSSSATSYALFTITVQRQGSGIVMRLVVPVLLLLVLSTLTFWATYEERVNITITLLLSVSALYIVILGNIPLVGYLTNLDKFIFWMFLLLVIVVILHQAYATLYEKLDRWPLRIVYLRLLECTGRTFVLPAIILYYMNEIPDTLSKSTQDVVVGMVFAATSIILFREYFGLRSSWKSALRGLIDKVNHEDTVVKDLSWVEIFVLNVWKFGVFSTSPHLLGKFLQNQHKLEVDMTDDVKLRNLGVITDILHASPRAGRHDVQKSLSGDRDAPHSPTASSGNGEGAGGTSKIVELTTFSPMFVHDVHESEVTTNQVRRRLQSQDVDLETHGTRESSVSRRAQQSDSDDEDER